MLYAICYERFFKPNTEEELHEAIKKSQEETRTMKNDIEKMIEHGQKWKALLITPTNNTSQRCPTPN